MPLVTFILASIVIELTPGPNMTYLAMLSATGGRRAGFTAVMGVALGLLIIGLLASFGLAELIASVPVYYETIRWAGVLYLLYLAWQSWTETQENSPAKIKPHVPQSTYFQRGLITNLLNPKAALFYVATLPSFIIGDKNILQQMLVLTLIYVSVATIVHMTIITLAGMATPWLANPRYNRITRRVCAGLLVLIALWFALTTGSDFRLN